MTYHLFIDDVRNPDWYDCQLAGVRQDVEWHVVRTSAEAQDLVLRLGMPASMALDHDLGDDDIVPNFLTWLAHEYWDGQAAIPTWVIHSANPVGRRNMQSFMKSWQASATL